MLKQIIEPLGTLTSIFHHYFFQIFPPSHKHIVLLTCPPCTASHYLSYFTVNQITLIKIVLVENLSNLLLTLTVLQ